MWKHQNWNTGISKLKIWGEIARFENGNSHQIEASFDKLQSLIEKKIDDTNVRFNQQINYVEERLQMHVCIQTDHK